MSHLLLLYAHPLQAQVLPGETGIERVVARDLLQYLLRVIVSPWLTEPLRQFNENLPVGLRTRERPQGTPDRLHVVIDVGHAAFFFCEGHRWQHDISLLCRFAERDILYHQKIFPGKICYMPGRVRSHHIQRFHLWTTQHFSIRRTALRWRLAAGVKGRHFVVEDNGALSASDFTCQVLQLRRCLKSEVVCESYFLVR